MLHYWTYPNQWRHSRCLTFDVMERQEMLKYNSLWFNCYHPLMTNIRRGNRWNFTQSDKLQSKLVRGCDSPSKCWGGFLQGFLTFCWHSAPIPPASRTLTGRRRWLTPEHDTDRTSSTTLQASSIIRLCFLCFEQGRVQSCHKADRSSCSGPLSHQRTPRQTEDVIYFWDPLFIFWMSILGFLGEIWETSRF